jgi:hypothetical protein
MWYLSFWLSHQYPVCFFLLFLFPATCPAHHTILDWIILSILSEECKLWSTSLCSFLRLPVTSSLFSPNILLSTLFLNTLTQCSSLNVRHPYRTTGNIIVLHITRHWYWSVIVSHSHCRYQWTAALCILPKCNSAATVLFSDPYIYIQFYS